MAVKIDLISDDPIVLVTFSADITQADVHAVRQHAVTLKDDHTGTIYQVYDVREATIDFAGMMEIITEARRNQAGGLLDPSLQIVIVGRNAMIDIARDTVNKELNRSIPVFNTVEAAIEAINIGMLGKSPE
jgi:hypothetical protein